MKHVLALLVLLSLPALGKAPLKTVSLAATDWCPYACENAQVGKGMVVDYLQYVLADLNLQLDVTFYPWSRAIKQVEQGAHHGLLTAVPAEAPAFKFTSAATMTYQVCFFTALSNDWQFDSRSSLRSQRIAIISEYGYGEPVDSYVLAHRANSNRVIEISGAQGVERLAKLVKIGRASAFLEDANVVGWRFKSKLVKDFRVAGCLPPNPFFIAFSPALDTGEELIELLNHRLQLEHNRQYLQQVVKPKYLR